MKFLNPKSLEISDINFTDYIQLDIDSKVLLTTKVARLIAMFDEIVPKPKTENRPVTYVVNVFEENDYLLEDSVVNYVMGLILTSLNQDEPTRDKLITLVPESMSSVSAPELSILGYLNYSKGNPIQIQLTRVLDNGSGPEEKVNYLI